MGYTCYFEQSRPFTTEEWGKIRAAVIPMFHRLKQIKGPNGEGRPLIGNDSISFNGDASKSEDHETFLIQKNGNGFQFCKTARKPYDRYVKAVLCVADHFAPGALDISCDGDDEEDCWTEGVRIAQMATNNTVYISPLDRKKYAKMTESTIAASQQFQESRKSPVKDTKTLRDALNKIKKLETIFYDDDINFLINYLEANFEDIKDAYQGT